MEGLDVGMSQTDRRFQVFADNCLCLVDLCLRHFERRQVDMVKLQLIALDGFVTALTHIGKNGGHRLIQLRDIQMRTLHNLRPLTLFRISDNIHLFTFLLFYLYIIIFSIGVTRIPWAPISFSLPMISQNCFWSSTV